MSTLVFLHKAIMLSGITWQYTAQKFRNGELIQKSQGARDQIKMTTTVLKASYILYEKYCTIQAKNDETVATRK